MHPLHAPEVPFEVADPAGSSRSLREALEGSGPWSGSGLFFLLLGLLTLPVGIGVLFLTLGLEKMVAASTRHSGRTRRAEAEGISLGEVWVEPDSFAGIPGFKVHQSVRIRNRRGECLELTVRVRGPDGGYLTTSLGGYRGHAGEIRVTHRTEPLASNRMHLRDHWIFLPRSLFEASGEPGTLSCTAELLLTSARRGEFLSLGSAPFQVRFRRAAAPTLPLPSPQTAGQGRCQVCGDVFGLGTVSCPCCETGYHTDCWEYVGGCAVFGCSPG